MPKDPTPVNMSVKQAAAYIGVSERFVRGMIAERVLPYCRVGGKRIIIRRRDIDDFLESRRIA